MQEIQETLVWIPGSGRSHGEGSGNSFQYSCLENPMDRRVWWPTVYRVAKSQTWLKRFSTCMYKTAKNFLEGTTISTWECSPPAGCGRRWENWCGCDEGWSSQLKKEDWFWLGCDLSLIVLLSSVFSEQGPRPWQRNNSSLTLSEKIMGACFL